MFGEHVEDEQDKKDSLLVNKFCKIAMSPSESLELRKENIKNALELEYDRNRKNGASDLKAKEYARKNVKQLIYEVLDNKIKNRISNSKVYIDSKEVNVISEDITRSLKPLSTGFADKRQNVTKKRIQKIISEHAKSDKDFRSRLSGVIKARLFLNDIKNNISNLVFNNGNSKIDFRKNMLLVNSYNILGGNKSNEIRSNNKDHYLSILKNIAKIKYKESNIDNDLYKSKNNINNSVQNTKSGNRSDVSKENKLNNSIYSGKQDLKDSTKVKDINSKNNDNNINTVNKKYIDMVNAAKNALNKDYNTGANYISPKLKISSFNNRKKSGKAVG